MPDFLGGHPDNLTEFISYRITGVPKLYAFSITGNYGKNVTGR